MSQLGYGGVFCKYLENKALRQGTTRMAEIVSRQLRPFLSGIPGHKCLSHANSRRFLGRCLTVPLSHRKGGRGARNAGVVLTIRGRPNPGMAAARAANTTLMNQLRRSGCGPGFWSRCGKSGSPWRNATRIVMSL